MGIQPGVGSGFSHAAEGLSTAVTQQWITHHPAAVGEQSHVHRSQRLGLILAPVM